jgi:hypothetical protein
MAIKNNGKEVIYDIHHNNPPPVIYKIVNIFSTEKYRSANTPIANGERIADMAVVE